ncbi:iron-containing redox enzyme family protein [Pyxidicoccus fallax]|uniref:Iron-containing redox enzyme family protein n=1 Tax=Pyxidicoccus fallax TaxID=394095 RepID=A0A848LLC3_9BACT|nr:iron-containing redox enzyme family protein [Pyxidicoccus fallax]NMO18463.1 iron-containing redox enzyme family protein [Pyxidicoccus fallax]NPC81674.1 iron-containing redox enzyme family protein [Pyxidicoccus fallax]
MSTDEVVTAASRFAVLDKKLKKSWEDLFARSRLVKTIQEGRIDKRLYAVYLMETYQYTLHNARNQALVGVRALDVGVSYLKFCFEHATEETGHEHMALHDMLSLGLPKEALEIPPPLPATEALIAYLYWVSATGNPLRRLGYSYWAESSYDYIMPLIDKVRETLELKPAQMTFFIAHSKIDEDHAEQVRRMIAQNCKTDQDWHDVERVLETSLRLMGNMMEEVFAEYELLRKEQSATHAFLGLLK